jgi:hypothetical protein
MSLIFSDGVHALVASVRNPEVFGPLGSGSVFRGTYGSSRHRAKTVGKPLIYTVL